MNNADQIDRDLEEQWGRFQLSPQEIYLGTSIGCVCISKDRFSLMDDEGCFIRALEDSEIAMIKAEFKSLFQDEK